MKSFRKGYFYIDENRYYITNVLYFIDDDKYIIAGSMNGDNDFPIYSSEHNIDFGIADTWIYPFDNITLALYKDKATKKTPYAFPIDRKYFKEVNINNLRNEIFKLQLNGFAVVLFNKKIDWIKGGMKSAG